MDAFGIIDTVYAIVDESIPVIIGAGLVVFLWGLVRFMTKSGDVQNQQEGKSIIIWGIIILFVAVSVWGLVGVLTQITGIDPGGVIDPPMLREP